MDKKYQVFISSTYIDLEEERKEVIQALLEIDCIPTGMEMFQASDDAQWDLIKRVIDECDYYIVIVSGRYGSIHPVINKSYTQMEYEYAISKGIPIVGFLHKAPENLPAFKTERGNKGKKMLIAFRDLVKQKMIRYWSTPAELGGLVSRSMIKLIKTHPREGWVRSSTVKEVEKTVYRTEDIYETDDDIILSEKYYDINIIKKESECFDFHNVINKIEKSLIDEKSFKNELPIWKVVDKIKLDVNIYDLLYEIGSVCCACGATSMSEIMRGISDDYYRKVIHIDMPKLQVCEYKEGFGIFDIRNISYFGTLSAFKGDISGIIAVILNKNIVPMCIERNLGYKLNEIEFEYSTMKELGNVLCSTYLNSLSWWSGIKIELTVPILDTNVESSILNIPAIGYWKQERNAVIIETSFKTDDREIDGVFTMMLGGGSVKNIIKMFDELKKA